MKKALVWGGGLFVLVVAALLLNSYLSFKSQQGQKRTADYCGALKTVMAYSHGDFRATSNGRQSTPIKNGTAYFIEDNTFGASFCTLRDTTREYKYECTFAYYYDKKTERDKADTFVAEGEALIRRTEDCLGQKSQDATKAQLGDEMMDLSGMTSPFFIKWVEWKTNNNVRVDIAIDKSQQVTMLRDYGKVGGEVVVSIRNRK